MQSNKFHEITDKDMNALFNLLEEIDQFEKTNFAEDIIETRKFQCIDPAKNHRKYYHISLYKDGVKAIYGRIGSKGQVWDSRMKKGTMTDWEASQLFIDKYHDKMRKGYKEVK